MREALCQPRAFLSKMKHLILILFILLTACAPLQTPPAAGTSSPAAPTLPAKLIRMHASSSVQAWGVDAYTCADKLGLILQDVPDAQQADLLLRLGEPQELTAPSFQIGQEDVLVVTNRESPVQNLDLAGVQGLFTHPETQQVQIWVFAPAEDIQQIFSTQVMRGQPVSSFALVAASPQQMSDHLNQDKNALGLMPRHWLSNPRAISLANRTEKAGTVREVFSLPNIPVLAIVKADPHGNPGIVREGALKNLLACLQK